LLPILVSVSGKVISSNDVQFLKIPPVALLLFNVTNLSGSDIFLSAVHPENH
jgi:hypothetical protein